MRKLGDIISDLELLCEELVVDHDLQRGDILNLVYGYLSTHYIISIEEYEQGGNPIFFYGPEETLKNRQLVKTFIQNKIKGNAG